MFHHWNRLWYVILSTLRAGVSLQARVISGRIDKSSGFTELQCGYLETSRRVLRPVVKKTTTWLHNRGYDHAMPVFTDVLIVSYCNTVIVGLTALRIATW
jgi:hypothetical protein